MKEYAYFRDYIVTARDGTIPLNAKAVCMAVDVDKSLLRDLLAQANLAHDLRMAMSEENTRSAQFKDAFAKFEKVTDEPF